MMRAASGRRWGQGMSAWALGVALVTASLVQLLEPSLAQAAPPRPGAAASTRQKAKAAPKPGAKARARAPSAATAATAAKAPAPPAAAPAPAPATAPAPAAGTPSAAPANAVVRTEEREGEKTYTFGAQEVEGRLKSPQILYFLRRVRAQFDPAPLGHRSFLLELSDTRRHPALE
jgi:hypothetical protein